MQRSNPNAPVADTSATAKLVAAWVFVGIPFAWGVYVTAGNVAALFK